MLQNNINILIRLVKCHLPPIQSCLWIYFLRLGFKQISKNIFKTLLLSNIIDYCAKNREEYFALLNSYANLEYMSANTNTLKALMQFMMAEKLLNSPSVMENKFQMEKLKHEKYFPFLQDIRTKFQVSLPLICGMFNSQRYPDISI